MPRPILFLAACFCASLYFVKPGACASIRSSNRRIYSLPVHHNQPIQQQLQLQLQQRPQLKQQHERRTISLQQMTLSIRGGANVAANAAAVTSSSLNNLHLLARELVAKAACTFLMGQSTTAWLAPHRTCLKYGLTPSVLNVACNRKLATAYLGSTVLMYGMLFQQCTTTTAVGASAVVWMMEQLKARLFYEAEECGRPVIWEYSIGGGATLTAAATLWTTNDTTPTTTLWAMKISSLLLIFNGLAFFIAPARLCRFWGIPIGIATSPIDADKKQEYLEELKRYNETIFLHRYMGVAVVFSGILQAVLAWTNDIYQAIGSAFGFLFLINCWSFLKTSDFKRLARVSLSVSSKIDMKKRLSKLFFPMFNAAVSSTLLLLSSSSSSSSSAASTATVAP